MNFSYDLCATENVCRLFGRREAKHLIIYAKMTATFFTFALENDTTVTTLSQSI